MLWSNKETVMSLTTYEVVLTDRNAVLITRIESETLPNPVSAILAVPAVEVRQAFPDEAGYHCASITHELTGHVVYTDGMSPSAGCHDRIVDLTRTPAKITERPATKEYARINPSGGC
jgi:hypothetical protein